ncbi:MAG: hypothetical protein ACLTAX_04205 [Waltera sp.]
MTKEIQSEAHLTTFEAISMIVGNSIGTGIIAVPYLATKNSMLDVVWMVLIAYCVNVILHLIIAELSYNNGGVQLVKSFEGKLFHGKMKQIFRSERIYCLWTGNYDRCQRQYQRRSTDFCELVRNAFRGGAGFVLCDRRSCGVYRHESRRHRAEVRSHCPHGNCGSDDGRHIYASAEFFATGTVPLE